MPALAATHCHGESSARASEGGHAPGSGGLMEPHPTSRKTTRPAALLLTSANRQENRMPAPQKLLHESGTDGRLPSPSTQQCFPDSTMVPGKTRDVTLSNTAANS